MTVISTKIKYTLLSAVALGAIVAPATAQAAEPIKPPSGPIVLRNGLTFGSIGTEQLEAVDSDGDFSTAPLVQKAIIPVPNKQQWSLIPYKGTDQYLICSIGVSAGQGFACLDIAGDKTSPGNSVVVKPFNDSKSQVWRVTQTGFSQRTFNIQNMGSGLYLDRLADVKTPGKSLVQNKLDKSGDNSQRWLMLNV
jgi:hypothetical protein